MLKRRVLRILAGSRPGKEAQPKSPRLRLSSGLKTQLRVSMAFVHLEPLPKTRCWVSTVALLLPDWLLLQKQQVGPRPGLVGRQTEEHAIVRSPALSLRDSLGGDCRWFWLIAQRKHCTWICLPALQVILP